MNKNIKPLIGKPRDNDLLHRYVNTKTALSYIAWLEERVRILEEYYDKTRNALPHLRQP